MPDLRGAFALFSEALGTPEHARSAVAARTDGDHLAFDDLFNSRAPGASGLHPLGEVAIDDRDSAAVRLGLSQFPHRRHCTEHPFAIQVSESAGREPYSGAS
jgi:hypothetical protein